MERVGLGTTRLEVSRIGLGASELGADGRRIDEKHAAAAIRRALETGINLFESAHGYGESQRVVGRALRDELDRRRDELVIAVKGGVRMDGDGLVPDSSPEWLRTSVEQSLTNLGIDHIDLFEIDGPDPKVPFAESAGALDVLAMQGKIRHVGVSSFSPGEMAELGATRPVEALQTPYGLLRREAEYAELGYAREHDAGVLACETVANGVPRHRRTIAELERLAAGAGTTLCGLAVAWALSHPVVDAVIVDARSAAHVADASAAASLRVGDEVAEAIDRITTVAAA
jgi:aryl-alcohol dehydrogenase-like predicted oxidoreductase